MEVAAVVGMQSAVGSQRKQGRIHWAKRPFLFPNMAAGAAGSMTVEAVGMSTEDIPVTVLDGAGSLAIAALRRQQVDMVHFELKRSEE